MRKPAWFLALALAGCAADQPPVLPSAPAAYLPGPVPAYGGVPADWWRQFGSTSLDALVEQGLRDSPTLAAQQAQIRAAQANAQAVAGGFLPQLSLNPAVARNAYPVGPSATPPQTIISLTGTVSYDPGLFGVRHYNFANQAAQIAYQQAELDAARQTLAGNIVAATLAEAGYQAQIDATNHMLASQRDQLHILQGEFALGAVMRDDVLRQQSVMLAAAATLPGLTTGLEQQRDRLAVLTGQMPDAVLPPLPALESLQLPATIPVSEPSAYLQNRPDLRAALALVAAQDAQLGLATAHLYPDISLSAQGGYAAETLNSLFEPGSALWTLAGSLLQPVYAGGTLHARRRQAQAELAGALASYRDAVLHAFGDAADVLQALQNDEAALSEAQQASDTANAAYQLTLQRFQLGATDETTVLAAQSSAMQQALVLVQARESLLLDFARLQSIMS
jgi:NodT family efflux transporter outer membrane factor (OMF) lipoprotein